MAMTLEQVRDALYAIHDEERPLPMRKEARDWAKAIGDHIAHVSQPTQAVDVERRVREIEYAISCGEMNSPAVFTQMRQLITRALSAEKARWRVPDGFAVALLNATDAYERTRNQFHGKSRKIHAEQVSLLRRVFAELFPASPTPNKEG